MPNFTLRSVTAAAAVAATALTFSALGCPAYSQDLEEIALRINFSPWAMHSQYFAAKKQGYYEDEGLQVDIRPPSAGQQNEVFIATGREQFGVSNVDSFIKANAAGLDVVAVMMDQPDTPTSIISLKEDGIDSPDKLKGKRIGRYNNTSPSKIDKLLQSGGLSRDDIELVVVTRGAEQQLLAVGDIDAFVGYSYGQPLTLAMNGLETNVLPLKDFGSNEYGTVLYTSNALLKDNPELVKRFLRATLKGLIWTKDNMRDAVAEVIKVSPDRNLDLETTKLGIIYDLYKSPAYAEQFGAMTDEKWQSTIDTYVETGELASEPEPQEVYTNEILDLLPESAELAKSLQQ